MRVLSYIMSFYMLFLALYPCLDIEPVAQDDSQMVSISDTELLNPTPSEDEGEHEEGHCSPFCMCHCCHTHIVIGDIPLFSFASIQAPFKGFHPSLRTDEVIRPFLRPPIQA